jgi:4-hydroxybenzoate polyprenyltransferase
LSLGKTAVEQEQERKTEQITNDATLHIDIPALSTGGRLRALVQAMRPKQWTKNLALFVGIVFSQQLLSPALPRVLLAFVSFCLVSSSIYLLNDLLDLENDRQHPTKSKRPLASGALPITWAITAIGVLLTLCMLVTTLIFFVPIGPRADMFSRYGGASVAFSIAIVIYFGLMVLYSTRLKHVVLLDVFVIAIGFVLRILAGTVVMPVVISPWLYLVTILLSLFLALSKRRNELILLDERASSHRQILSEYSLPLLDQMITIVTAATLMAYSLYTFLGPTGDKLMITIPFVLYGMFRYLYLVHMRMEGGSPEEILLRDRHMLATVLLCTALVIVVLYVLPHVALL